MIKQLQEMKKELLKITEPYERVMALKAVIEVELKLNELGGTTVATNKSTKAATTKTATEKKAENLIKDQLGESALKTTTEKPAVAPATETATKAATKPATTPVAEQKTSTGQTIETLGDFKLVQIAIPENFNNLSGNELKAACVPFAKAIQAICNVYTKSEPGKAALVKLICAFTEDPTSNLSTLQEIVSSPKTLIPAANFLIRSVAAQKKNQRLKAAAKAQA